MTAENISNGGGGKGPDKGGFVPYMVNRYPQRALEAVKLALTVASAVFEVRTSMRGTAFLGDTMTHAF